MKCCSPLMFLGIDICHSAKTMHYSLIVITVPKNCPMKHCLTHRILFVCSLRTMSTAKHSKNHCIGMLISQSSMERCFTCLVWNAYIYNIWQVLQNGAAANTCWRRTSMRAVFPLLVLAKILAFCSAAVMKLPLKVPLSLSEAMVYFHL